MHLSTEEIERTRETLERHRRPDGTFNVSQAAKELGIQRSTLQERVVGVMTGRYGAAPDYQPEPQPLSRHSPEGLRVAVRALLRNTPRRLDDLATQLGEPAGAILEAIEALQTEGAKIERGQGATFVINAHAPPAAYITGPAIEIVSRPDNTFVLGAMGDLHAGSKYCRWDVRADLIKRCEARSAQAILDTGNWIDGEASFNRYDLEAVGLSAQCKLLAARHPKTKLPIYAVTGDDHEGWYEGREGIDVGRYCEMIMRDAGHDWTNLGYMESHIRLVNANTGTNAILAVVHPGGGSAYAMSYKPQKIVECVPLNSEILTSAGWKRYEDIDVGADVLGYDISLDALRWTTVTAIHRGRAKVVRFSNDQFDVTCTPNHKWAIEWESRAGPNPNSVTPARYSRRDRRMWTLDESKDRSRIIQAAVAPDGRGFVTPADWLNREDAVASVMAMSSGERRAFIEGMLLGEGTVAGARERGYRTVVFSQRPGPVNDAFRLACFLEGIATSDRATPPGSFKPDQSPARRVTMLAKRMRICNRLRREELGVEEVWCPTTGLGTWVMRQGDLITITGNSLEGGEKPAVLLIGHYHKLEALNVRNTWVGQTGCCQDQSPFMRKKGLEAHVGGLILTLEQDPNTGAIIGFEPAMFRYFNRGYYDASKRWSRHGDVGQPPRER